MNEYCNFCWAKLGNGECFCPKDTRAEHCKKAKERFENQGLKEATALRDFLAYIPTRIAYLKIFNSDVLSNEYKYYYELYKRIKEWGKSHRVFFKYLTGNIDMDEVKVLYGVNKRECFRIMSRQRKLLIQFIDNLENQLSVKYQFIPMTDVFNEVE